MTHSWDIIIWKQENGIDYVPSCWANSDKTVYKYPLDISEPKARQLIYECKDINKNYEMCAATCKIANVTDLKKAQYYCQKGQVTSNIETSSDDEGKNTVKNRSGRSIRKPKKLYAVSSSPSSSDSNKSENTAVEKTISTEKNEGKKKLNKGETTFKKISFQVPAASSIQKGAAEGTVDTSLKTTASFSGNLISSTQNRSTTQVDTSGPVARGLGTHDKQNKIIEKLNSLQFEVGEMKNTLQRIENLISLKITLARNVGPNEDKDDDDNLLINLLPCNTHEDVLKVEEIIKNKSSMQQLIHTLHLLGGNDPHKSVYLMMSKLLTRTAALEYSALGKQKKKAFASLKMYEALIIAVRKRYPSVTTQKLKESVGLYLATAKSRLPKVRVNDADEAHETEVE